MGKLRQIGGWKTNVYTDDNGYKCVKYHDTDVVKFNNDYIILNHNGWCTHTTKKRMNQASDEYNLGFRVSQSKGQWYVDYNGFTHEWEGAHVNAVKRGRSKTMTFIRDEDGARLVGDIPTDTGINEHARMDGVNQEYNDYRLGNDEY
tara:strand:- start:20646 stop:21086 length:441 start_codon:yes stop_codon:yes gene_type:complete